MEENLIDPKYILELTKSIHREGEKSITDYINRNTEILLNEHASIVREQVVESMKKQIESMNKEIALDAQKLEEDVSNFLELIQNSYQSASHSFNKVKELAKENFEKVESLNETQNELFMLQTEIQLLEQQLLECLMCTAFLDDLFPLDKERVKVPKDFLKSFGPTFTAKEQEELQKAVIEDLVKSEEVFDAPVEAQVESADAILKVIDRLKSSNLSLVQYSHISRGSTKYESQELIMAKQKMEEELKEWEKKIFNAEKEVAAVKETLNCLKKEVSNLDQEQSEKEETLQKEVELAKISEIYKICTGSSAKNVDPSLMKATIDACFEDLLYELNKHPKRRIKDLFRVIEAEKKQSMRRADETARAKQLKKKLQRATALISMTGSKTTHKKL
ncbi:coiled-coil domain-containing protein 38-like [Uloborus diversus]|uniref:coiled-coil domain-containing protein 38-like n=1 Tax=Uloborus diversus TaxID=327109 RepID=UPI00240A4EC4|nr:coiled-coil domain-containing protein 38-like [Uloborus diversus]